MDEYFIFLINKHTSHPTVDLKVNWGLVASWDLCNHTTVLHSHRDREYLSFSAGVYVLTQFDALTFLILLSLITIVMCHPSCREASVPFARNTHIIYHCSFWIVVLDPFSFIFLPFLYIEYSFSLFSQPCWLLDVASVCRPVSYPQSLCGSEWYKIGRESDNCGSGNSLRIILGTNTTLLS